MTPGVYHTLLCTVTNSHVDNGRKLSKLTHPGHGQARTLLVLGTWTSSVKDDQDGVCQWRSIAMDTQQCTGSDSATAAVIAPRAGRAG